MYVVLEQQHRYILEYDKKMFLHFTKYSFEKSIILHDSTHDRCTWMSTKTIYLRLATVVDCFPSALQFSLKKMVISHVQACGSHYGDTFDIFLLNNMGNLFSDSVDQNKIEHVQWFNADRNCSVISVVYPLPYQTYDNCDFNCCLSTNN